ncbi:hypothetical protein QCA50_006442 [Cerrena zonata]|uniref:Uncharacterized protein n=1 Tax=Cerrena zonata TaxID=2478898 RepID=A0AAW0G8Q0_9APHY
MILGYIPQEEWLLKRVRRKKLMKFSRKDSHATAMALDIALQDIICEVALANTAWVETVVVKDEYLFAIAVASNSDTKKASPEEIQRLKDIFKTTRDPKWYYVLEY